MSFHLLPLEESLAMNWVAEALITVTVCVTFLGLFVLILYDHSYFKRAIQKPTAETIISLEELCKSPDRPRLHGVH